MKNQPLISVIIVNWNGKHIIAECLDSLLNQDYKALEIIVVDNNSSDGSVQFIRKHFKTVKIIESMINLGFAGGNNRGFEEARGEYILLFNTDAIASQNFLQPLVKILENKKEIGIVQPMVLYTDNKEYNEGDINSAGTYFLDTGFLYYKGYGKSSKDKKYHKSLEVFSAYGACMLIRRQVIEKVGLFDSDFFMYFEETDFCIRALLAGFKIYFEPLSFIYHKGGVSSRTYGNNRIFYHSFKNRIASYIKNFETSTLFRIVPLHLCICFGLSFAYLFTGKPTYFFAIQKSFLWNIVHFSSTCSKRKQIQKEFRTISDSKYLPHLTAHPRLSYYLYLFKGLQYYKD